MPDILVVKSTAFLPHEKMQAILDNLKEQTYLEVQIVPENIEIKLVNGNGECILIPSEDF